ncbi:TlpA family protein disulfide reductase [Flavivirga spongiicola]|uniref:TlpA family protein disulfide reductase n=1 Tax=Flavivirga spongiicola TaxID=421621 RepID=A0ABU7XUS8_9FLAO|nr:TlpA disulfide reductase family protein [Flavivirga sp. MEBiC05379]MDO5979512.1 TlpA disulfide reductase family protein [Flavivirga sp. MEBiC05379]
MKNLYIIVILTLVFTSCQTKKAPVDYVILSGKILNVDTSHKMSLSHGSSLKKDISFNMDGTFKDTIKVDKGNYVLSTGKSKVYLDLEQGNNIVINFDDDNVHESLKLGGKGFEKSIYQRKRAILKQGFYNEGISAYDKDESSFLKTMKSHRDKMLDNLTKTKNLPEDYIAKEKREIEYLYLDFVQKYVGNHIMTDNNSYKPSQNILNELKMLSLENEEDFLKSKQYRGLLKVYMTVKSIEIAKANNISREFAYLEAAKDIKNSAIRNGLIFGSVKMAMGKVEDMDAYFQKYVIVAADSTYASRMTEVYQNLQSTAKGNPSPKFVNYRNYNGGTTSLEDFKGKYVFIDVWATWCGPCMRQMPYLKKIEKKYHNKNILFVSISADKERDYKKWRELVAKENLTGIQLIADNAFESSFINKYNISSIPRFILLDPSGNIIDNDAPDPSDPKLEALFKSLKI